MSELIEELKPCPWCGCLGTIEEDKYFYPQCSNPRTIEAGGCECSLGAYPTEAEAIAAWNTRHQPESKYYVNIDKEGVHIAPLQDDDLILLEGYKHEAQRPAAVDEAVLHNVADAICRNIAGQMKAIATTEGYTAFGEQDIDCISTARAALQAMSVSGEHGAGEQKTVKSNSQVTPEMERIGRIHIAIVDEIKRQQVHNSPRLMVNWMLGDAQILEGRITVRELAEAIHRAIDRQSHYVALYCDGSGRRVPMTITTQRERELSAEVERLQRLLEGRDEFIVTNGLWTDFVALSNQPSKKGE